MYKQPSLCKDSGYRNLTTEEVFILKKLTDGKKCVLCAVLVLLMGVALFYTYSDDRQSPYGGIIRLHIIANSDSVGDQALKLKVRDAVIRHMQNQEDLQTKEATEEYIRSNTDRLEAIAGGVVASEGYDYPVKAELGVSYIPERSYEDITFPAGNYDALNITIGSGKGANWWCVIFPPLCLLDEGTEKISDEEKEIAEHQRLQLKWKLAEIFSNKDNDSE